MKRNPTQWREGMQQIFKKTLMALSLSLVIMPAAYATNGLAPTGLGQVHKGMGGAAVGSPQNTTTMMTNPAAASFISDGYDIGGELFQPNRTVINSDWTDAVQPGLAGTKYTGDGISAFFIPEAAYKKDIGKYSVGVAAYGNGGMNTVYDKSPVFVTGAPAPNHIAPFNGGAPSRTGVDLKQIFISPTVSTKLNDKHSVGLSVNLVAQQFSARGLQAFQGDPRVDKTNPDKLKAFQDPGKSTATGIGVALGWMGELNDRVTVGASYRAKTKMGKFKKYIGLFAGGSMDVPAALTVGFSAKVTPKTTIAMDVQKIYYSDVKAIGNSSNSTKMFGDSDGAGFGWDDQVVYKLGIKSQVAPKVALMAGYNHGDSPVTSEGTRFNALTPAVVEDHLSLGFEYKLSKSSAIIGSYTHTFGNTVKGDSLKGQPFDLEMDQDAIGIGYSKTF